MILSPERPCTETVATIRHRGGSVLCWFKEHNEAFREVIKRQFRYTWDEKAWCKRFKPEINGKPVDRAAELAAALIQAGFVVEVDQEIADLVQAGAWEPEHRRWVINVGEDFGLRWWGQPDDLYHRAKLLPESHWDTVSKSVIVPKVYYAEVGGFAEEHDFRYAESAKILMGAAERDYARMILPSIPQPSLSSKPKAKSKRFCDPARFADLPLRSLTTKTTLLPHQAPAVEKALPLRVGALFMDMGTGKTRCAIELVARRQQRISKVIWFCPVSLKSTIAAEIAKHTDGETIYVFDDVTSEGNVPPAYWYIVGIESISSSDRIVMAANSLIDADSFVIVDESSYIKGASSVRTMRITELSRRARYRLLLTGTPLSQGIEDLYAQMRFLDPAILGYGSFYSFARAHLEYSDKYPGMIVRATGMDSIAQKVAPYVYQVTKEECLSLPEKLYDRVYFDMTQGQAEAYQRAKDEILPSDPLEDLDSYTIFQLFTALQQVASGFRNVDGNLETYEHKRLALLMSLIGGIPESEKVIIWCKFLYSLRQIADALPGCAQYCGDLSEQKRQAEIERFRGDGCRFLVATQATGGHGLTLNEATHHVFYENEFKYSHRIQAEDRSHRIGQTRPVTYIDLVSNTGIDRRIQAALEKKQNVVRAFRQDVKRHKDVDL